MTGLLSSLEASVPALRSYAAMLLADRREADELVRACLVAALNRPQARSQAVLRVWLLGLVHQGGLSRLRRKGIRWQPASPGMPQGDQETGAQTVIGSTETMAAFAKLPVELRSVLFLVSVEELSYAEAAEVLGVAVETVMSLLSEGRRRLRALEVPPVARRLA